ncbi:hypothetical protein QFZ73_001370 [Peribacillus sp. V2I11]|nr:hypothetical protein [Peribacillus sp. V2I11]
MFYFNWVLQLIRNTTFVTVEVIKILVLLIPIHRFPILQPFNQISIQIGTDTYAMVIFHHINPHPAPNSLKCR